MREPPLWMSLFSSIMISGGIVRLDGRKISPEQVPAPRFDKPELLTP